MTSISASTHTLASFGQAPRVRPNQPTSDPDPCMRNAMLAGPYERVFQRHESRKQYTSMREDKKQDGNNKRDKIFLQARHHGSHAPSDR